MTKPSALPHSGRVACLRSQFSSVTQARFLGPELWRRSNNRPINAETSLADPTILRRPTARSVSILAFLHIYFYIWFNLAVTALHPPALSWLLSCCS